MNYRKTKKLDSIIKLVILIFNSFSAGYYVGKIVLWVTI
jgi:hypothetical protein